MSTANSSLSEMILSELCREWLTHTHTHTDKRGERKVLGAEGRTRLVQCKMGGIDREMCRERERERVVLHH